jgi:hypothetical protein
MVRTLRTEPIARNRRDPAPLAFTPLLRDPQALLAPQPLGAFAVDRPALIEQMLMRLPVPPPRPLARERPQLRPQRRVVLHHLRLVALGGAMLTGKPARPTLRETQPLPQHENGTAPPGRAQKFPADSSFSP